MISEKIIDTQFTAVTTPGEGPCDDSTQVLTPSYTEEIVASTAAELPTENIAEGSTAIITADGSEYIFNGTSWVSMGGGNS